MERAGLAFIFTACIQPQFVAHLVSLLYACPRWMRTPCMNARNFGGGRFNH